MQVFLTSPWIPPEWVKAHGLVPRGIWSAPDFYDTKCPLSAGICSFSEASARFAGEGKHCVVFTTMCDQLRRGFDTCNHSKSFLFNLPATWQSPTAREMFRSELERLSHFLVSIGGSVPSVEVLRDEMLKADDARRQLLDSAPTASAREFAEAVAQFHWDGTLTPLRCASSGNKIPIALAGGPFIKAHWALLDEIENAGAYVAVNATETGERSLMPNLDGPQAISEFRLIQSLLTSAATKEDLSELLIEAYVTNIVDVFIRPNTKLYFWLKTRLTSRGVRGIVLWNYTGCDLWRAEGQSLRENFGLPVLLLETSEQAGVAPRELTRLQAFLEMLR